MTARRLPLLLVVLATIISLPAASSAQSAKALLKRGNTLFANAEYQQAFEVFKRAYDSKPKAVFLRSMAFCQLKLYRHAAARELLQRYLKKFPRAADIKKMRDLEGNLEVVVQTKVKITSTPPGAAIFIDAEVAGQVGKTPAELTIEPGKHVVILKAPGFHTTTQSFSIAPRETKAVAVVMEVPISVRSTPDGAAVHFDSATADSLGVTPLATGITPGTHRVFVKKKGYKTYEQSVNVQAGKAVQINATLQLGLTVASVPAGATVEIDGKPVQGKTPLEAEVTAGRHTVVTKLPPCNDATEQVNVVPGGPPVAVKAQLSGCGLLSMRTNVEGAEVKVAGSALGVTPLSRAVKIGKLPVTVSHPDRRQWSGALDFSDRQVLDARLKMGRPSWPAWLLGGIAVASVVVGTVGTIMAYQREGSEITLDGGGKQREFVDDDGTCYQYSSDGSRKDIGCGSAYMYHHMATAGLSVAGTTAVSGFLYYWFLVRPSVEIKQAPMSESTNTASKATAPTL